MQFLSSCHDIFIFLYPLVTSHVHVSYSDFFLTIEFSVTAKRFEICQYIHLCYFYRQFVMDFTSLVFNVMYCHIVCNHKNKH